MSSITFIRLLCDLCKKNEIKEQVEVDRYWYGACKECIELMKEDKEYARLQVQVRR